MTFFSAVVVVAVIVVQARRYCEVKRIIPLYIETSTEINHTIPYNYLVVICLSSYFVITRDLLSVESMSHFSPQPGNVPGRCWAFHGREGYVAIKVGSYFDLFHFSVIFLL